jgi:hypothetical protein
MGKRDVTVYTCDGCHASTTVGREERAVGFSKLFFPNSKDYWLCTVCYGAVEWVARFQNITRPPSVYKNARGYGLRKEASDAD